MNFYHTIKKKTFNHLLVAYHIIVGFNAFYLIEVLHEAMIYKYNEKEVDEFLEIMDIHYYQGIATNRFYKDQMLNEKIKDDLLANAIINNYGLYKACLAYLVKEYKVDVDGIINFFKHLYYSPDDKIVFMDYVQAHRWFSSALNYYKNKCTMEECYKKFFRIDAFSNYEEVLTMSEVEKFAENINKKFQHVVEKRKIRRGKLGERIKKKEFHDLKAEV